MISDHDHPTRRRHLDLWRHRWLLAAVLLAAACSSPRAFRPFATKIALAPGGGPLDAVWVDELAFVDVQINGKPAGRMLLDTGASVVLLAPHVVRQLGLERLPIDPAQGGLAVGGASQTTASAQHIAPLAELRCGPLTANGLDAVEIDLSTLSRVSGGALAGILPATVFRDVLLVLDYPARTVQVLPPPAGGSAPATSLPLGRGPLPQVAIGVGERSIEILIDSGDTGFLTLPGEPPLPLRSAAVATGRQLTIAGAVPRIEARLAAAIDWAGHRIVDPVVELTPGPGGAAGSALLRHFRVELDQFNRRINFVRAARSPVPCPPVRSLGFGFLPDLSHWEVAYVLDGSPAGRAGIKAGDRVLAIDGLAAVTLSRRRFQDLLAERDGVRVTVGAADGSSVRHLDLTVAVLVP